MSRGPEHAGVLHTYRLKVELVPVGSTTAQPGLSCPWCSVASKQAKSLVEGYTCVLRREVIASHAHLHEDWRLLA